MTSAKKHFEELVIVSISVTSVSENGISSWEMVSKDLTGGSSQKGELG